MPLNYILSARRTDCARNETRCHCALSWKHSADTGRSAFARGIDFARILHYLRENDSRPGGMDNAMDEKYHDADDDLI